MSTKQRESFEPWAWFAFALGLATLALFLYLGARPGGEAARRAYRFGPLAAGGLAAIFMLGALLFCLRRRPVLQRRRVWPLATLGAALWFCSLPIAYPSAHEGKFSPTSFRLPFVGPGRVRYGGEERGSNPLLFDPARRFGLCFEPVASGATLDVVAPCAGTVRAALEVRSGFAVVLESRAGEFCVLEGLDGGPSVAVGAELAPGAVLGSAPGRLLFYLTDQPEPGRGDGIPLRVRGYRLQGREVELGLPAAGQELEGPPPGG